MAEGPNAAPETQPASWSRSITGAAAVLGSLIAVGQGGSSLVQSYTQIRSETLKTNSELFDKYFELAYGKDSNEDNRTVLLGALSQIEGHPLQGWAKDRYDLRLKSIKDVEAAEQQFRAAQQMKDTAVKQVKLVEIEIREVQDSLDAAPETQDARKPLLDKMRILGEELTLAQGNLFDATAREGAATETVAIVKSGGQTDASSSTATPNLSAFEFIERLTVDIVKSAFPSGTSREVISENVPYVESALKEFNLTSPEMIAYVIATIRIDAEGFAPISESPSKFNTDKAPFDKYDPRLDLGNTKPGDGALYKGRGYVQLTGRANYARYSQLLGLGSRLLDSPDDANDPDVSARMLCAYIAQRRLQIQAALEKKDFAAALTRFSGAPHGMENFASAYTSVWRAIALLPPAGYGVVFSADKTPQSAMDEVHKALSPPISAEPVLLYNRQGFWRSVAFFGTQGAAAKRLADFKGVWPEAYVVDISSWCPTPKLVSPETKDMAEQKDCQF